MIPNSLAYNITTENEVANILSRFNSNFVFDIIRDNLEKKFNYSFINSPNVVASFEQNFKMLQENYPSDIDNILIVRDQTYKEIIELLCQNYGLQFNDNGNVDYYSLAYYMYDFLAANFTNYIVLFFANYIYKEKNNLYECLNMDNNRKNKDSGTIYGKKIYKDIKLAVLNANLDYVISNICAFDITFENILTLVYNNKNIINFMLFYINPINDFFKFSYCNIFNSPESPAVLTNIRLEIQKIAMMKIREENE